MQRIKDQAQADGTFMKAPNGKPTRLSERQWLQVRTDKFKKWFGDWELANKKVNIVKGDTETTPKNIAEAKEYARKNLQGKSFVNKDTNEEITIGRKSIDKSLSQSALGKSVNRKAHVSAIRNLDKIIENSILAETHPDRASDPNIEGVQRFYGAIEVDGDLYRTKTTVKKIRKEGNKFYTYEIQEMELLPERSTKGEGSLNPDTGTNSISATKLLKGVEKSYEKGKFILENSSKVVDENGEPLEVAIVQTRNLLPSKTSRKTIAVGLA